MDLHGRSLLKPADLTAKEFVRASGQPAAVGALTDAADILAGRAGTTIGPV